MPCTSSACEATVDGTTKSKSAKYERPNRTQLICRAWLSRRSASACLQKNEISKESISRDTLHLGAAVASVRCSGGLRVCRGSSGTLFPRCCCFRRCSAVLHV